MKNLKKALALLLVAAMAMSLLCVGVFADNVDVSTHTFEAYQIFSGTQATDGGALGNVEWGNGVNGDALLTAIKADTTIGADFTACTTAAQVAEKLATYSSNSDKAKAFARLADANKTSITTPMTKNENGTYTMSTPGYYLIVDTTDVAGKQDAKNLSLLAVSTTATITSKTDVSTVEKKVQDKNDSTDETSGWQDSADYDIGDEIPYQITATLGDLSNFKTYNVKFTDTMTHLTLVDNSVAVSIDGTDKTTAFTTDWDAATKTLTVTCADVKDLGATTGSKIVVTYKATLDADAVIGSTGNPNKVYLEYSNNPNGEGMGKTTEDTNIVFTYKVVANKVDQDKKALVGASFKLEKKNADGTWKDLGTVDGTSASTFEWKGIDDGIYKITETKTPAGYNTIDPIEFTVTAEHDITSDNPALTKLLGGDLFTGDVSTGAVTGEIVNKSGSVLPTTGGVGTTLFYVFGAILVLGAGVLLITKKRMSHE